METRRLDEQVRRNLARFPADFIFTLTATEFPNLNSQIATSSWGGRRKLPFVFTEHGAIMTATVLNSPRAVEMSALRDLMDKARQPIAEQKSKRRIGFV